MKKEEAHKKIQDDGIETYKYQIFESMVTSMRQKYFRNSTKCDKINIGLLYDR